MQPVEVPRNRPSPSSVQPAFVCAWEFVVRPACVAEFERANATEYAALDARCESLTEREREIGRFEPVGLG